MDTIILAFFVSNSLIAVYEVSWGLASLFAVFSKSIRQTLFPEMSRISSQDDPNEGITDLVRLSLAYAGLFIIPGLVGAALVGETVLTIYGSGFETGHYILILLAFARLLDSYMEQLVSAINAVDRPKLTLYVNGVFIVTNLVLNVFLTWQYGWYGAATATTVSAGIGLLVTYHYANNIISVIVPIGEIAKQWLSAGVMSVVVLAGRLAFGGSLPVVIVLVGAGGGDYFVTLLAISRQFRTTVQDNLSFAVPLL
jgi:O-antigen/teichoic acid export membrane protein